MATTSPNKTKRDLASGGAALSAAVLIAWGLGEAGVEMPEYVVIALGTVIGWVAKKVEDITA